MGWKQNYYDTAIQNGIPHNTAVYIARDAGNPGAALSHALKVHAPAPQAPAQPAPKAAPAPPPPKKQEIVKPPVQQAATISSVGAGVGTSKKKVEKRKLNSLRIKRKKKETAPALTTGSPTGTGLNTPKV